MPFFIGGNYAQGIAEQMILREQQQAEQLNNQQRLLQLMQTQQKIGEQQQFQKALQNVGLGPGGGQIARAPTQGEEDQGLLSPMVNQVRDLQIQASTLDALAATPGIGPDRSMALIKESAALKKTAAATSMEVLKERGELYNKLGNIFGGVKDQQGVDLAMAQARRLDPDTVARLPVDRDPNTQRVLATPRTIQALQGFANQAMTQSDRLRLDQMKQNEADREEARRTAEDDRKQAARDRDAAAARAQEGLSESRAQRKEAHQDAVTQRVYTQAQTIGNEYKTDPQVQEFANHKKMFMTSYNYVYDDKGNVKPEGPPGTPEWSNHDSASDFELSKQFIAMVHPHYRGTTYDAKELRSLANMPEHLANMIAGVAAGRVLAQSDRVNMINAMKRVLNAENQDQIQREDKALQRVQNLTRGVDVPIPVDPEDYVTKYAIRPEKRSEAPMMKPRPGERTATNPTTGEKLVLRDGKWQPLSQ